MRRKKKPVEPGKPADALDWLTGRIAKVTTTVTALGGLALLVANQAGAFRNMIATWRADDPACLQAHTLEAPGTVKSSEWETMRFKLKGQNSCRNKRGVYVALSSRTAGLFLTPQQGCQLPGALQVPGCWGTWWPVDAGHWEREIDPPPLEPLHELRPGEEILLSWEVRDSQTPSELIRGDTTRIKVQ